MVFLGEGMFLMGEVNLQVWSRAPLSHSLRAICTVLLDPRDHLLHSGTQGFTADPVYGRAKCLPMLGSLKT